MQNFFARISFGLLGYRMDRSHSIMRIATTASPVSGAEIRDRAEILSYMRTVRHSLNVISCAWLDYKERNENTSMRKVGSAASFGSAGMRKVGSAASLTMSPSNGNLVE